MCVLPVLAIDPPPPVIQNITVSNGVKTVTFTPSPAIEQYDIKSSVNVGVPFTNDGSGVLSGTTFRATNSQPTRFYSVAATPLSSNDLLSVNLLNRIAYGPTPDELVRVKAMGPQAYIAEQLAPEVINDSFDVFTTEATNSTPPLPPQWQFLSFSGTVSSSNLYLYLTQAGDAYIDDMAFQIVTNRIDIIDTGTNFITNVVAVASPNLLQDGDFENTDLTPPWTVTANMIGSSLSTTSAHSGSNSLHLVSAGIGSTEANSIYQRMTNLAGFNFNGSTQRCILSFWYLPGTGSHLIKTRLSGSGVVGSGNAPAPASEWIYATATGLANATKTIYIYTSGAGEAYIDDVKLVAGSVAGVGPNLIRNGDFEAALETNNWNATANFTNSLISSNFAHSGLGSLKVVASAAGAGNGNSLFQTNIFVTNGQTYTVSFWYMFPTRNRTLTVRLSGANDVPGDPGLLAAVPRGAGALRYRLENIRNSSLENGGQTTATIGGANLFDLRAYHVLSAVSGKRQLIEVLLQFLENHFVTQNGKSFDYLDRFYDDGNLMDILATDWDWRERTKWQAALLNPNCNFYDLLKIHVESPAEIVYLDTVDSKGNGINVANENYAREIQELFAMGVDNGYDQNDIIAMSRAWTGWSVDIVDEVDINNPFAAQSTRVGFYAGVGSTAVSNLVGVWTFNYKSGQHGTNRAPIWSVWDPAAPATNPRALGPKLVPARFGAAFGAGTSYQLALPQNRTGTNGILDGYDITASIANLPFTMEYISVKLCRLLVHEDFPNPNTFVGSPEYDFYDYTNPNRSAEAELVRQCMTAWNTPVNGRKGNIRSVLSVILNSDLFRSHGGSLQKVKTPLEFAVATIRSIRSTNSAGAFTASTDGYSISGRSRTASSAPLTRMGTMMLFDRDAPDGFPEAGAPWISSGTLAERVRFIQTALMATTDALKGDGISGGNFNLTDPVGLLKAKLAPANYNNAGAVADLFLGYLFPGEGKANLDDYRNLAINFLNTNDNGVGSSLFTTLVNTTAAYDTRVRSMVSMLMTLPRFQEQ